VLDLICETTTAALEAPSLHERETLLRLPPSRESYADALVRHRALFDRLELAPPPVARTLGGPARVAFWNAERGKDLDASATLLASLAADVFLLCELDLGMARSGQAHTTRALAQRLRTGYAFAVEFLELGLGDAKEQTWHAGEVNQAGLHGAAILTACALQRPAVIRLETTGDWFDGRHGERRVGGRIAVAATVRIARTPVTLVSVHFESHGDPAQRALQMACLIEAIDTYAPGQPVLIGGDLNTSTTGREWARGTGVKPVLPALWVLDPVPYEPMFEVAAGHGYDWRACNALNVPTQRTRRDGTPTPPLGKIDWFLCRDLVASDPATLPAIDGQGLAISDHEVLVATIAPKPAQEIDRPR
jgi:endonuclease/exonuclease/phosphatase family metal-dependent hydrolase